MPYNYNLYAACLYRIVAKTCTTYKYKDLQLPTIKLLSY